MTSTSIDYQQASQMKDCVKHAQSDRLHGLFGRLLTVSVAVPVSLFLLSSYQLRIVFGLCLSTLGGLELQTSFNRHLQIKLSLCQRLLCTVPSSALLISTAMFGRTGLSHSLFLIPIAISCYFVLYNMGHGPLQSNLYNRYVFALFQCFYIGGTLAHASLLNDLPYALEALLYTILVTCVGEAFGFFGGVVFGQHHITRISPGKTLEGYLSTLLAGVATSFCFDWVLNWFYPESRFPLQHLHLHGLSILISLMASIGDLLESLVKRGFSIKDMGDVLPGMGGLLDRLDALLFAFPTTYYYLLVFHHLPLTC